MTRLSQTEASANDSTGSFGASYFCDKMRAARRGKEAYAARYEEAMRLHSEGLPPAAIAERLGISYSAAYHWVKGLRTPKQGNVAALIAHLEKNGPSAVTDLKEEFPKHNELFLIAAKRAQPVKRFMIKKKYSDYATWYYLDGQEAELQKRVAALFEKVKEVREKLAGLGKEK
jgi:predicted transcriptional regulator